MSTIHDLEQLLRERRVAAPPDSYTATLLGDPERIQRKVMEEAFEVCLEVGRDERDPDRVASETADLLFHVLVALVECDVPFDAVVHQLEGRRK